MLYKYFTYVTDSIIKDILNVYICTQQQKEN